VLKIHEIRELIKLIDESSIQEFNLETEGGKLSLKKASQEMVAVSSPAAQAAPAPAPAPAAAAAPVQAVPAAEPEKAVLQAEDESSLHAIVSPMVGTFYKAPEPGKPPYVQVGDKVSKNTVVCIVEAMKLFNEIEAEVDGVIVKVLVEDGQLVEYGQPLFLVKPE